MDVLTSNDNDVFGACFLEAGIVIAVILKRIM